MDDYVGGIGTNYMTNGNGLKRGLELLGILEEDLENVGAEDLHQLMHQLHHQRHQEQLVLLHLQYHPSNQGLH